MITIEKLSLPAKISAMPTHCRVWIYKADCVLDPRDVTIIRNKGGIFARNWMTHGESLAAEVDVLLDRFVVLVVDEKVQEVGGCSIDTSVGFILELEKDLDLKLTDRMIVWYEEDGEIRMSRTAPFKDKIAEGLVTGDTIVYNDLVNNKSDLETKFRTPVRSSWLNGLL